MFYRGLGNFFALSCALTALAAPSSALAQEEEQEEPQTAVSKVKKQNGCSLLIKNDSNFKAKQKVTVTNAKEDMANATVKSTNPNGTAILVLEQKSCKMSFVGGEVVANEQSDSAGGSETGAKSRKSGRLPEGVQPDSSAEYRIKHPFSVRVGGGYMFAPGGTAGFGYSFGHTVLTELTVDTASLNFLSIYKYSRLRIGALGSYFAGNSFYTSGGLVFEQFSSGLIGVSVNENGIQSTPDAFKANISQLQAQIGIGNRWNLGRFVIGSEWVGISVPFANMSESYTRGQGYEESSFESDKKANKDVAGSKSLRLLNSYIGFSF